MDTARRILTNLARRLEVDHPGAAKSLREGLDETLTVIDFGLPKTLRQSLQTTNVIESALSIYKRMSVVT
jgi:transposase-like protein